MKLATCRYLGQERIAIGAEGSINLLPLGLSDIVSLAADPARTALLPRDPVDEDAVTFLPPVPHPEKIFCVGVNYRDHGAEAGIETLPTHPSLFVRFPSSQVGHRQPMVAPSNSQQYDFEGELAVIIGQAAWRVAADEALRHVVGYSCFAENSVRDFQAHARQVTAGKNFLASGAFGPWLVTADEVGDPARLSLTTRLNGEVMQHARLSSMIFSVGQLISYISQFTRLMPGDVIATGTPAGVGVLRAPPVWMKPGDFLEIEIPGVGLLQNTVRAEDD
jgi:2-keto-4-pentenoate hydratase/2-oxohepta-3-ene-1,7-dioic acid hydratase in catechol pathway